MDPLFCLKPIGELLSESFFIPSYQRGYRWGRRHVQDLLADIDQFRRTDGDRDKGDFYCLQPVVIKKRVAQGDLELIDGQQRITTIFLILAYLHGQVDEAKRPKMELRYKTRKRSKEFLDSLFAPDMKRLEEQSKQNIDFFHIFNAYKSIQKWFEDKDEEYMNSFYKFLVRGDDSGKEVRVIWYELPHEPGSRQDQNAVEVFIRLNVGKIRLTNAELIRALLLRTSGKEGDVVSERRLRIAQEWHDMETWLRSDSVWHFIHHGEDDFQTRIEYIFKLMAHQQLPPQGEGATRDRLSIFLAFSKDMPDVGESSDKLRTWQDDKWREAQQCYMRCREWYEDRTLYHLVGFLVNNEVPIARIEELANSGGKEAFKQALKEDVFRALFQKKKLGDYPSTNDLRAFLDDELGELQYPQSRARIRRILLFFNIATLLQDGASNLRFPFDLYKSQSWDIEHIHPVTDYLPGKPTEQKGWLENIIDYWSGDEDVPLENYPEGAQSLLNKARRLVKKAPFPEEKFDRLAQEILRYFGGGEPGDTENGLGNLTLLEAGVNRSYKNVIFPLKRKRIIQLGTEGVFAPRCTTHVFLKYYSRRIDQMMFWKKDDQEDYLKAIKKILLRFFDDAEGGAT